MGPAELVKIGFSVGAGYRSATAALCSDDGRERIVVVTPHATPSGPFEG